jgi:exodeoxyribonuclease VII small subunit
MTAWNYETAIAELETLIHQLETGELPLEQVFQKFETATQHLQQCEAFLQQGQTQMTLQIETLTPPDSP